MAAAGSVARPDGAYGTQNGAFLFGDPLLASAGLDRLAHRAEVLIITGDSFRQEGRRRLEQEVHRSPAA